MKNLLIYVHPRNAFDSESLLMAKIQIDNSLDLGWKKQDLMLATNFDFEYNGVKSITIEDDNFLPYSPKGSKNKAIVELFDRGILSGKELYWFHDLDAYQSEVIKESDLNMNGADMALTDYCWKELFNTGSVFFYTKAEDIYRSFVETHDIFQIHNDEISLMTLVYGLPQAGADYLKQKFGPEVIEKIPKIKDINKRILKINTSYNFVPFYNIQYCYQIAIKPIKVVHFHPFGYILKPPIPNFLNFYMFGENEINKVLMSERLIRIFKNHGFKSRIMV